MKIKAFEKLVNTLTLDVVRPMPNGMKLHVKGKVDRIEKGVTYVRTQFSEQSLKPLIIDRYAR